MRNKTFSILYLNRGIWKTVNNDKNQRMTFDSIDDAKHHIDQLRKDKTHPINLVKYGVIYQYKGNLMVGAGTRY